MVRRSQTTLTLPAGSIALGKQPQPDRRRPTSSLLKKSGTGPIFGRTTFFAAGRWPKTWTCPPPATFSTGRYGLALLNKRAGAVSDTVGGGDSN